MPPETQTLSVRHPNLLFESLPGEYLVLTPELRIAAVSDAYLRASHLERSQILGCKFFEVLPTEATSPGMHTLRASLDRVLARRQADTMPLQRYDMRAENLGGGERYWSLLNAPVFDEQGELIYIVHRVLEITEFVCEHDTQARALARELAETKERLRLAQAERQTLATRLAASDQELQSFSYSISHDLRAPLRAVDGFSRLLSERAGVRLDDEDHRLLTIVRNSAKAMGRLIDDLLHVSKVSRAPIHAVVIDMSALAEAAWARESARYAGEIQIETLPAAHADRALLGQVWIHLLSNAVKFSAGHVTPRITVSGESTADECIYHVHDNGVGFDMQYAGKLFGAFQRLHSSDEFPGNGIGLAIVARILARHGGHAWADSAQGAGAHFHFALPRADVSPQEIAHLTQHTT